jgi:hypothetical protein
MSTRNPWRVMALMLAFAWATVAYAATAGQGPRVVDTAAQQVGDPAELELLGQFGGSTQAMALDGSRAYVGYGPRVEILDLSDPTAPLWLGQTPPLPGLILDIVAEGSQLYIAFGHELGPRLIPDGGVAVVDLTDPTAPRVLAVVTRRLSVNAIAKVGPLLYLAEGGQNFGTLAILDVADPAAPSLVGEVTAPGPLTTVGVAGDLALALGQRGSKPVALWQFMVADPTHPAHRTGGLDGLMAIDVRGNGRQVFVVFQNRVEVYSPGRPEPVRIATLGDEAGLRCPTWVASAGDRLVVAEPCSLGLRLQVFALGRDGAARLLGSIPVLGGDLLRRPAVDGGAVVWYELGNRRVALRAGMDTAAPVSGNGPVMLDEVAALAVRDSQVYVPWTDRLGVLDTHSPGDIQPHRLNVFPSGVRILRDLTSLGDRLYGLAGGTQAGLLIYNLARPDEPRMEGRLVEPTMYKGIAVAGGLASIGGRPGVQIVDVTVPDRPRPIGVEADADGVVVTELAAEGGWAYVASQSGFRVLDLSAAPSIRRLAELSLGFAGVGAVDAEGGLVAVGGQDLNTEGFLQLLDVLNPRDPRTLAIVSELASAPVTALLLAGNRLLVGSSNGITVQDITDPHQPEPLAHFRTADQVTRLALADGRIYAADRFGGLWVFAATGLGLPAVTPTASATASAGPEPTATPVPSPTAVTTRTAIVLPWLLR